MNRAYLLFVSTFIIAFSLSPITKPEIIQAGGTGLNTQLLSDHSLTEADTVFNIYGYDVVTSGDVAHVYWQESGNGTEGIDLFYHQIPGGNTIRLSDPALSDGDVSHVWHDSAVAPNGTFHMIWIEETNTAEGSDLFYWSLATGTLLLSNHSETEGDVQPVYGVLSLVLDKNGNPHLFWYEETGTTEGEDLFYWNSKGGTILITNHSLTQGNVNHYGSTDLQTDDSGIAHIIWSEISNNGVTLTYFYWNPSLGIPINFPDAIDSLIVFGEIAHIFGTKSNLGPITYWNSSTQNTQIIPSSSDPVRFIFYKVAVDSKNTIHLIWGEEDVCLSHWDSSSGMTEELFTGVDCNPLWGFYIDNLDILHTTVVDHPGGANRFRYWNSSMTNPVEVPNDDSPYTGELIGIEDTNIVHLIWTENSGANDDYYHWDNINQVSMNISQSAGFDTPISPVGRQVEQSSDSELYMLWSELNNGTGTFQNFYWNSKINSTQNLFTELGINSISSNEITMAFLHTGTPYFTWYGIPNTGTEGFYLWDSAQDEIHLMGESEPCTVSDKSYSEDRDILGRIYVAWQGIQTNTNYWWSQATGQIDLSLTSADEPTCTPPVTAVSDNGTVFVVWIEESDVASEGLDIFGGWMESTVRNNHLPFIARP